jgi:hypothetical protein
MSASPRSDSGSTMAEARRPAVRKPAVRYLAQFRSAVEVVTHR